MATLPIMPEIAPLACVAIPPSDQIMDAYRSNMSEADFLAVVRDVYGDLPEDE